MKPYYFKDGIEMKKVRTLTEVMNELESCFSSEYDPASTEPIQVPIDLARALMREMDTFALICKDGGIVGLLIRTLPIISSAIAHGMPVTPEIAEIRNAIVGIKAIEETCQQRRG